MNEGPGAPAPDPDRGRNRGLRSTRDRLLGDTPGEIAVHQGDEVHADALRAGRLALAVVRAVAETFVVHLRDHFLAALQTLGLALGQHPQVCDLGRGEQLADALGQAATQAPQPMQVAASKARSATGFWIGIALASTTPPVFTDT